MQFLHNHSRPFLKHVLNLFCCSTVIISTVPNLFKLIASASTCYFNIKHLSNYVSSAHWRHINVIKIDIKSEFLTIIMWQMWTSMNTPHCCVVPTRWYSGRARTACCQDSRADWTENLSVMTYTLATVTHQNWHSNGCSWTVLSACLRTVEQLLVATASSHSN